MALSHLLLVALILEFLIPASSLGFGLLGGCGCPCGGRKKRSVENIEEFRFQAVHSDKLCNSPELKRIIQKNMADGPLTSKMRLEHALYPEGDHFFVVCTTGDSVYSAPRSSMFCSSTGHNHTCYVFGI